MSVKVTAFAVLAAGFWLAGTATAEECGGSGTEGITVTEAGGSYLCRPNEPGLFPGVLYSHGGLGPVVGGDLQGTCEALARAGYIAFAKLRQDPMGKTIPDHLQDVEDAFDFLLDQTDVDTNRIGVIGYSRGGALTYAIAETRATSIHASVLLAPAPAGAFFAIRTADVSPLIAPMMVAVTSNDIYQADHVQIAEDLVQALVDEGKDHIYFPYPAYPNEECVGCDGHEVFQVVDDEFTDYWCDIEDFLAANLTGSVALPALGPPALATAAALLLLCGVMASGFRTQRRGDDLRGPKN